MEIVNTMEFESSNDSCNDDEYGFFGQLEGGQDEEESYMFGYNESNFPGTLAFHQRNLSHECPEMSILSGSTTGSDSSCSFVSNGQFQQPISKSVRFSSVSIREYNVEVGDHPSCSSMPSLTLSWEHAKDITVDIDQHDRSGFSKKGKELVLPVWQRVNRLRQVARMTNRDFKTMNIDIPLGEFSFEKVYGGRGNYFKNKNSMFSTTKTPSSMISKSTDIGKFNLFKSESYGSNLNCFI